jgi:hypothetical protein
MERDIVQRIPASPDKLLTAVSTASSHRFSAKAVVSLGALVRMRSLFEKKSVPEIDNMLIFAIDAEHDGSDKAPQAILLKPTVEGYSLMKMDRQKNPKDTSKLIVGGLFRNGRRVEGVSIVRSNSWGDIKHCERWGREARQAKARRATTALGDLHEYGRPRGCSVALATQRPTRAINIGQSQFQGREGCRATRSAI